MEDEKIFWNKWREAKEEEQILNIKNLVEILKNSWLAYAKIEDEKLKSRLEAKVLNDYFRDLYNSLGDW
jgi:hypothetical protein